MFRSAFSALLALSLLLAGCTKPVPTASVSAPAASTEAPTAAPATPTAAPATSTAAATEAPTSLPDLITVTDGLGSAIQLAQPAQRVISLAPSNTEILYAIGAGSLLVARDDFSNYPEEANALPSIGGSMTNFNLEEITSLQPDLILASPLISPDQVNAIKVVTPNVFVVPNPTDLEGLYTNLVNVGMLTGHQAEAEQLAADLRARADAVLAKTAAVTEKPKVFYELDATEPAKPWTAGPGTFIDLLIGLAGGENIGASLQGEWAQISQEELIVQDPEIILLGDALYGGITPESLAGRPGWGAISAVKNERVLPFNDDLVSRPGPRMIEGLEELAKVLHPELFE